MLRTDKQIDKQSFDQSENYTTATIFPGVSGEAGIG